MLRIGMLTVVCLLLLCAGCDPAQESPAQPSSLSAEVVADPQPSPEPVPGVVFDVESEVTERSGVRMDLRPVVDVPHPIAGRTAFPAEGEVITQPIPAKRLSEEDPFTKPIDPAGIPDVVPWAQAKQYVGYTITVEGMIVNTGQSRDGNVHFLNFHQDWRGKFYMVAFDDLAKTLPQSVDATFRGKTLRVTGEVEEHRGRPQIKILSMDQVEFVGE